MNNKYFCVIFVLCIHVCLVDLHLTSSSRFVVGADLNVLSVQQQTALDIAIWNMRSNEVSILKIAGNYSVLLKTICRL